MVNRSGQSEQAAGAESPSARDQSWQDLPESVKYGDLCYQAERYADALEAYRSALEHEGMSLHPEVRARLHYRLASCYTRRANFRLALEQLDEARKLLPRHLDKVRLAKIHARRGHVLLELARYDRAERYLTWAKKLLSGTNEHEELALIEMNLGNLAARQGRSREARQSFLNALTTYQRIGDKSGEAGALNNLGLQYKNACEWREAVRCMEEARTLFERLGFRHRLMASYLNLGIIHWKLGKWELSEENLAAAEAIARELGDQQLLVKIRLAQGNLALRRRQWAEASALYESALRVAEAEGFGRERILAMEFQGEMDLDRGELDRARDTLVACLQEARTLAPAGDLVTEVLRRLAEVRLAQGAAEEALSLAKEAAAAASRDSDRYEESVALRSVGLAMMETGRREEGERIVEMSLSALSEIGESFQKGLTHLAYGRTLARSAIQLKSHAELERGAIQLQRAYGAFLDLDARVHAALAAYERAVLEVRFQRFEEAAAWRAKARQVYPAGADPDLEGRLERLGGDLEKAFAERWASGSDVLASLREMKRLFQGASDTDAVLRELIRLAVTRSRSDRGIVAHATERGVVRVVATYGWTPEDAKHLLEALGSSLTDALHENRPLWANNTAEDDRFRGLAEAFEIGSLVLLPLTLTDDRSGLLWVDKRRGSYEGVYHQGEVHLLTILANLAALSLMERWNSRLIRENEELRARIALEVGEERFVTVNAELQKTLALMTRVANSPVSVLLEGETGTGKGLLAQLIHQASDRRNRPFVQINCAALPEQLLESELFGHVKGAFTGASFNKVGLFKEAEEGTLFLDEVDKASLAVQAKLLHVMDSKEVRPVGSVKSYRSDTRIICATNVNLRQKIDQGEFLEDLYYRLNDFILVIPPLRDRRDDIPVLVDYFVKKFSRLYGRSEVKLTPEVHRTFLALAWRGNVRELEKTIRRLVVLADEEIPVGLDLLPIDVQALAGDHSLEPSTLREEVARTERRVIGDALRAHRGNKAQVARTLKISYPCLLKKIKEYDLSSGRR